MGGAPLLLALAALGIDYGYQPDGAGGLEYIVQVPAELLRQGVPFESNIDPSIRPYISKVIVRYGNDRLPKDDGGLLARGSLNSPASRPISPISSNNRSGLNSDSILPHTANPEDSSPMPIPALDRVNSPTTSKRPQADGSNGGLTMPGINSGTPNALRDASPSILPSNGSDYAKPSGQTNPYLQTGARDPLGTSGQNSQSILPQSGNSASGYGAGSNLTAQGGLGASAFNTSSATNYTNTNPSTGFGSSYDQSSGNSQTVAGQTMGIPKYDSSSWQGGRAPPSTEPFTNNNSTYAATNAGSNYNLNDPRYANQSNQGYLKGYANNASAYGSGGLLNTQSPTFNGSGLFPNATASSTYPYNGNSQSNSPGTGTNWAGSNLANNGQYPNLDSNAMGSTSSYLANQARLATATNGSGQYPSLATSGSGVLAQDYDPRYASSNDPRYTGYSNQSNGSILPNTRGFSATAPFSRRALDFLLLFSISANAYLMIGLSRLLAKYRNLVANVRGISVTS